ncbi:MAG: glutamate 5-kinase [Blastochloris sp.]|nr:glutamate 5-kinase [Blastochloris sp.]
MKSYRKLWVVKVGSGLLTHRNGGVDRGLMASLVNQIVFLKNQGVAVVLVSSGAISAGMSVLDLSKRPTEQKALQACATIGQPRLMEAWNAVLKKKGLCAAQILLTSWDLDSRKLYGNTQATLKHLLSLGNCVPVFNENDALSFEEIEMLNRFGDNDRLSAQVALLAGAQQLVILSSIDGLRTKPDGTGDLVHVVREIDATIMGYAGRTQSQRSVGE